ncbi:MAG: cysteine--tRNA ligase [Planctomycetota bacterium]
MTLRVHNTLSKRLEAFEPREPGVVRMYNCGPTVYGRPHIGNLRSFLFADLLRRWLEYRGFEVRQVMNITDVGHLQGDDVADATGEDKVEVQARREAVDPLAITRRYTDEFLADMRALGVREPQARPRASEYIAEMVAMIERLMAQGHAYRVGDNVYFDVSTFPAYGKLSGNRVEGLEAGARIEVNDEKRHPADFALWKSDERHLMKWATVFGEHGFPGWHIECSAMARALLGEELDIHTGGEDNVFPHHECEIAQSECANGVPFARYWMHAKFLQVDGGKMSKSLGNVYTLSDVVERGYEPRHLRFALLRGHYRSPLNFTWTVMDEVKARVGNLDEVVQLLHRIVAGAGAGAGAGTAADPEAGRALARETQAAFEAAMDEDLNVPMALAALDGLRKPLLDEQVGAAAAQELLAFLGRVNEVLPVLSLAAQTAGADIEALIAERQAARQAKDWKRSDELRDLLAAQGIELKDTPEGVVWMRK